MGVLVSSGPANVTALQDAMPEVASLPCQATETGWLNQPLKSAARAKLALTPVGGSASIFSTLVVTVVVPPSLVAEQLNVVPFCGPLTGTYCSQGADVIGDSGSLTIQ